MLRYWRGRSIPRQERKTQCLKCTPLGYPSAITDHAAEENHTIDWEGLKFPARDTDWTVRVVKEAVEVRKTRAQSMNREEGCHQLPTLYSKLLVKKTNLILQGRHYLFWFLNILLCNWHTWSILIQASFSICFLMSTIEISIIGFYQTVSGDPIFIFCMLLQ